VWEVAGNFGRKLPTASALGFFLDWQKVRGLILRGVSGVVRFDFGFSVFFTFFEIGFEYLIQRNSPPRFLRFTQSWSAGGF